MQRKMENLEKVDLVRQRMNVSYEEAKMALEAADWDVTEALVILERKKKPSLEEEFIVRGNELVEKIKEIIRQGNINRIKIKQDEKVLVEIPVNAGVIGVVLAPQLAIIGAIAALFTQCTVEIVKNEPPDQS
jgi:hypothetical protein